MKNLFIPLVLWLFLAPTHSLGQNFSTDAFVPGELIVQLDNKLTVEEWCLEMQKEGLVGAMPKDRIAQSLNLWNVSFDAQSIGTLDALLLAERSRYAQYAQLNHTNIVSRSEPNDPLFPQQWALHNDGNNGGSGTADMDALSAWDITSGGVTAFGDSIVVAVIDGGFTIDHEDLEENIFRNWNEIPGNGIDDDSNGYVDDVNGWNVYDDIGTHSFSSHGTHVAGIVGAKGNNALGVAGVNWDIKVLPISGSSPQESTVLKAYGYVLDMRRLYNSTNGEKGAYIVATNASFGVDYGDPADFPGWCAMYDSLGLEGVLSAGATANLNINIDNVGDVPTACGSNFLISVTNTTSSDVRNSGAAYGEQTIDLGAPGTNIRSTTATSYGNMTGTSMATPQVAGALALMYSAMCPSTLGTYAYDPASLAWYVRQQLLNEGVDELNSLQGMVATGGRLNLFKAVESVVDTCAGVYFDVVPSICDSCQGSLTAIPLGGTAPFTYSWSTGDTSRSISGLCAGVYSATVTDADGLVSTGEGYVSDSDGPSFESHITWVSCYGLADGMIEVEGNATFEWLDGGTGTVRTGLSEGSYTVIATDSAGCKSIGSMYVSEPTEIEVEIESNVPVPYSSNNGVIELGIAGGTPPYEVIWPDQQDTIYRNDLEVGEYSILILDANGCELEVDYLLGFPAGVKEDKAVELSLYPNPTEGTLTIGGVWNESDVKVRVHSSLGGLVMSARYPALPAQIDLQGLPNGMYMVELLLEGKSEFYRVVKQ